MDVFLADTLSSLQYDAEQECNSAADLTIGHLALPMGELYSSLESALRDMGGKLSVQISDEEGIEEADIRWTDPVSSRDGRDWRVYTTQDEVWIQKAVSTSGEVLGVIVVRRMCIRS